MPSKIEVLTRISDSIQKLVETQNTALTPAELLNAAAPDPFSVLFAQEHSLRSPHDVKVHLFSRGLENILRRCKVISFADWANVDGLADEWDRFRTQMIKPLGRRDFEFIFYLGNMTTRPSYEVDEILDVIGDFSFSGRVTVILTNKEAVALWNLITSKNDNSFVLDGDSYHKGQYIFNAMNIHRLLIYSPEHRLTIFSGEGRDEWRDQGLYTLNLPCLGRDIFNTGYILGLLLQFDTVHSAALGLAMSGAFLRNKVISNLDDLNTYIRAWIDELDQQFVEH